ncbi:MAG: hypothetical protein AB8C84_12750 [Oligoflexales bacterium]
MSTIGHRKFRNFLMQPTIQMTMGIYLVLLSLFFAAGTSYVLYSSLKELVSTVLTLTDMESEVHQFFLNGIRQTVIALIGLLLAYTSAAILLSIIYTHRMVGPTVAFCNQLQQMQIGNFSSRIQLRKGDAFGEVATEINQLAQVLEDHNISLPSASDSSLPS